MCWIITTASFAQVEASRIPYLPVLKVNPDGSGFDYTLPFGTIRILDSRFDTTKLGYVRTGYNDHKLIIEKGLTAFEKLLNQSAGQQPNSYPRPQLLLVVKKLWLTGESAATKGVRPLIDWRSNVYIDFVRYRAKIEVYLEKDSVFIPLRRFDSTFSFSSLRTKRLGDLLMLPFSTLLSTVDSLNWNDVLKNGRRLQFRDIHQYNQKRQMLPILEERQLKSGLYLTFQDFIHNRITPYPIQIVNEREVHHVYIVANGERTLAPTHWGLCDGQNFMINKGMRLYTLVRQGNAFDFFGGLSAIPQATRTDTGLGIIVVSPGTKALAKSYAPHQIDMESGAID